MAFFSRKKRVKNIIEAGIGLVRRTGRKTHFSLAEEGELDHYSRQKLFKIYRRAYDTIPLATAIVDKQANNTIQEFFFEGPNKKKLTKWADELDWQTHKLTIAKSLYLYGNAYVEPILKGDKVVGVKHLNPIWIDVYRSVTGDVIGYSQIIGDEKEVLWGTTGDRNLDRAFKKRVSKFDHIVHFKHGVISSEKYGRSVLKSLIPNFEILRDMEQSLGKVIFKYVAPLIIAQVGSDEFPANQDAVDDVSSKLRDLQAESELTVSHLVDLKVLDFNAKGMDIQTPIKHIENQVIMGGQVPPVILGKLDGNDKAAEYQIRDFKNLIKSNQRELKAQFEKKIIQGWKLGVEEDKLVWMDSEERMKEVEFDMLRGLVTDGILTPQKANDLLPPRFRETLPEPVMQQPLNQQKVGDGGQQVPRPTQRKNKKVTDNPNNPQKTTKNPRSKGKRVLKSDREEK